MYQVSERSIPKAGTWAKLKNDEHDPEKVECDQMWDRERGAEACHEDERIDPYIDSLETFQKELFFVTLHQCNYNFDAAKQKMDCKTLQIETEDGNTSETQKQKCDKKPHMLEGTPLSRSESQAFNKAINENQKQFSVIAKAVGTTVNRCGGGGSSRSIEGDGGSSGSIEMCADMKWFFGLTGMTCFNCTVTITRDFNAKGQTWTSAQKIPAWLSKK